eukprot:scaffold8773_cov107-Isochrysis_galbana.AAC.2
MPPVAEAPAPVLPSSAASASGSSFGADAAAKARVMKSLMRWAPQRKGKVPVDAAPHKGAWTPEEPARRTASATGIAAKTIWRWVQDCSELEQPAITEPSTAAKSDTPGTRGPCSRELTAGNAPGA